MWGFLNFFRNANSRSNVHKLNAKVFKEHIENESCTVLDVRTLVEFSRGHIKKAINCNVLDKKKFLKSIDVLNKEKPVYLYCQSGNRSWVASKILVDLGFKLIYDLKGGYSRWRD